MRPRLPLVIAALALAAALLSLLAMARPASAPTLDQRAQEVAASLKCPVCHDLSVADSPAPVAAEMRKQIRERLAEGRTPDQVRAEFVASYGDWILIAPPRRGVNWVAWLGPGVLAAVALLLAALALRAWTHSRPESGAPRPSPEPADRRLLAEALARFREEVE
jgi:cytochrome c-type biogenesis protein CcmH